MYFASKLVFKGMMLCDSSNFKQNLCFNELFKFRQQKRESF